MPQITILFGVILIALGLAGYLGTGLESVTALIPAFVGIPLVILGSLAIRPGRHKVMMHIAVVIGALGFLAPLGRLIPGSIRVASGEAEWTLPMTLQLTMVIVLAIYLALCVMSFVTARKAA